MRLGARFSYPKADLDHDHTRNQNGAFELTCWFRLVTTLSTATHSAHHGHKTSSVFRCRHDKLSVQNLWFHFAPSVQISTGWIFLFQQCEIELNQVTLLLPLNITALLDFYTQATQDTLEGQTRAPRHNLPLVLGAQRNTNLKERFLSSPEFRVQPKSVCRI